MNAFEPLNAFKKSTYSSQRLPKTNLTGLDSTADTRWCDRRRQRAEDGNIRLKLAVGGPGETIVIALVVFRNGVDPFVLEGFFLLLASDVFSDIPLDACSTLDIGLREINMISTGLKFGRLRFRTRSLTPTIKLRTCAKHLIRPVSSSRAQLFPASFFIITSFAEALSQTTDRTRS